MFEDTRDQKEDEEVVLDVREIGREIEPGVYELTKYVDGAEYCDRQNQTWIWSIGRDPKTGRILAATDGRFYMNPDFACIWLR